MPTIQVADKPTLDWIKNKFYKTDYTATASNNVVATLLGEHLSTSPSYGGYNNKLYGDYTVLHNGTYRMSITFKFTHSNTSYKLHLGVFKNGILVTEFYSGTSSSFITKSTDVSAKKGDIIDIRAYTEGSGSNTFNIELITVGATYSSEQVEINLEDIGDKEYNNTMGGEVGTSASSPTTINGKGVITFIGAGEYVYFSVDGGTKISVHLTIGATPAIYFNETITVYGTNTRYVAQTI